MYALNAFRFEDKAIFVTKKGLKRGVAEQCSRLSGFIDTFCQMYKMQAPLGKDQIAEIEAANSTVTSGSFVLIYETARSALVVSTC